MSVQVEGVYACISVFFWFNKSHNVIFWSAYVLAGAISGQNGLGLEQIWARFSYGSKGVQVNSSSCHNKLNNFFIIFLRFAQVFCRYRLRLSMHELVCF